DLRGLGDVDDLRPDGDSLRSFLRTRRGSGRLRLDGDALRARSLGYAVRDARAQKRTRRAVDHQRCGGGVRHPSMRLRDRYACRACGADRDQQDPPESQEGPEIVVHESTPLSPDELQAPPPRRHPVLSVPVSEVLSSPNPYAAGGRPSLCPRPRLSSSEAGSRLPPKLGPPQRVSRSAQAERPLGEHHPVKQAEEAPPELLILVEAAVDQKQPHE